MAIDKSAGKVKDDTEKKLEEKAEEKKAQAVNDANEVAHDPSKAGDIAKERAAQAAVEAQQLLLQQAEMAKAMALNEAKAAAAGLIGDALGGIPGASDIVNPADLGNAAGGLMDQGAGDLTQKATGKDNLTEIKPSEPSF